MIDNDNLIEFHPSDDDVKRVENILRSGGFVINQAVVNALPQMVNMIRLYREVDRAALAQGGDR